MADSSSLIRCRDLTKHFRVARHRSGMAAAVASLVTRRHDVVRAVDGVSFDIHRGELVGYLGPNGAGKSTTVKMLAGVLVPTAGEVTVDGRVPWRERNAHAARIGVVFGQRTTLWWDLPVAESLDLLRHVYGLSRERFRRNLQVFDDLLGLGAFLGTPVRSLSLGQRMRSDLAAAMLHDPAVVFLDEPTIGLDVVAKERIRCFVREMNARRGVTVVLTTHDMQDVERLCDRVLMIDHGRLLYDGSLQRLQERFGGERELVVDLGADYDDVAVAGARVVERRGRRVTYRFPRHQVTASDLIARVAARFAIADLTVREPQVEATVRRIYEQRLLLREESS